MAAESSRCVGVSLQQVLQGFKKKKKMKNRVKANAGGVWTRLVFWLLELQQSFASEQKQAELLLTLTSNKAAGS